MRVWLLVVLCSCNSIFDLGDTRVRGPDLDGDGYVEDDNCPAIANENQDDMDHDDVGDVCDPCVNGMQLYTDVDHDGVDDGCDACTQGAGDHDEDKDDHLDACDNCPAVSNDQTDTDGDGIGNDCDLYGTMQHRVAFTGFDVVPDAWVAAVDEWTITNDTIGPATPIAGLGITDGLWNRTDGISGTDFSFETMVTLPSPPPSNYEVGIALRSRAGGNVGAFCNLVASGTIWQLQTGAAPLMASFTPTGMPVRMRLVRAAGSNIRCEIVGGPSLTTGLTSANLTYTPVLYTNKNSAAFHYVELIE